MKQLWISDVPEKYDSEKDILLGPWCIEKKGIEAMPWLHSLVQATWLKQKTINKFIKENKNNIIKVTLIEKNYDWNFRDNVDFMTNGIRSKNFNHWLVSRLIEPNLPPCWIVDYKKIPNREFMVINKSLKSKINFQQKNYTLEKIINITTLKVTLFGI